MRRLAVVLFVLGLVALGGAAALGLLGVDIDVGPRSFDCGAPIARLGGDDRETDWREESFLMAADPEFADVPPEDLPQVACKDKTDDRLTFVYAVVGVGVVLLLVAVVLLIVGRPRRRTTTPAPEAPPPPAP